MITEKPMVLLLLGSAHGGSTISNIVIGQHPDVFSAGTLDGFPSKGQFEDENKCSCGKYAAECLFWEQVYNRVKHIPSGPEREAALFQSITMNSGRGVVVDVSHGVRRLRDLIRVRGISLHVLYVRRSLRGVVFSVIRKSRERNEFIRPGIDFIKTAFRTGRGWWVNQKLAECFCQETGVPFRKISYDLLCRHPNVALESVGDWLGLDYSRIREGLKKGGPLLVPPHLIRGNRKLRSQKEIYLRADTGYLQDRSVLQRFLAAVGVAEAWLENFLFGKRWMRENFGENSHSSEQQNTVPLNKGREI